MSAFLARLRRLLLPLLRWVASRHVCAPVMAKVIASRLVLLPGGEKAPDCVTVMALNGERYKADLELLSRHPGLRIVLLPSSVQGWVTAPFLAPLRKQIAGQAWYRLQQQPEVVAALSKATPYVAAVLRWLHRFAGIDAIVTCTFYYWQDRAWERAGPIAGVPYVVLHKENQKDDVIVQATIDRYRQRGYRFHGSMIAIYNRKEQHCLVESGVAPREKTAIVGAPRMDALFRTVNEEGLPPLGRDVTLFSFRHAVGGLLLSDDDGGFSRGNTCGFIEYFDQVHAAMALLAQQFPDRTFHIKPKWMERWAGRIEDAIWRLTGLRAADLPNLRIGVDIGAQALIRRSAVVVGINSTTLIEARILGRPVVIPLFAEASEQHRDKVYFQKYFGTDFQTAETPETLRSAIAAALTQPSPSPASDDLVTEFLGFRDANSTDRVARLLREQATGCGAAGTGQGG